MSGQRASLRHGLPYGWWRTALVRNTATGLTLALVVSTLLALELIVLTLWAIQ